MAFIISAGMLTSCSTSTAQTGIHLDTVKQGAVTQSADESVHALVPDRLEKVAQSGLVELYIDPVTFGIAVKETSKNKFWYAIPADGDHTSQAAALTVTALMENTGEVYRLNSQDNSVAYQSAHMARIDNGVCVTYVLAGNAQTAAKDTESVVPEDVWIKLKVDYMLKDGSLITNVDTSAIQTAEHVKLLELNLLDFFGVAKSAVQGDFILVPDGSGALIHTSAADQAVSPVSLRVYGEDASVSTQREASSVIGIYGVKQGESAFCTIIEQGDAIARIEAQKAADGAYHQVGARFILRDSSKRIAGQEAVLGSVDVSGETYKGNIRLCHRFLSDTSASYAGMAVACREQLVRNGVLSTKTVEETGGLPFLLTTVGAGSTDSRSSKATLTTFEQATDIASQLKAKGVGGLYLRYTGALSGGYTQQDIRSAGFLTRLGGKREFQALNDYMESQKLNLFLDVNVLSASSGLSASQKANSLTGGKTTGNLTSQLYPVIGDESFATPVRSAAQVGQAVEDLLENMKRLAFQGYCVNDAGYMVYSDYANGYTDRTAMAKIVSDQIQTLSVGRKLMVDTGNFYALKDTDIIANMPLFCSYETNTAYENVPFIQMVLHGTLDYAGSPINLGEDIQTGMLRSIEYGACPSYFWVYQLSSKLKDAADKVQYEQFINDAAKYYERANAALADLRGARMTQHTQVQEGVFKTEYNSSSLIYVNYNDTSVKVDGVTISAKGFLRIN